VTGKLFEPEWVTDWSQTSRDKAIMGGQGTIQELAKWLLGDTLRKTWQRAVIILYNPASGTRIPVFPTPKRETEAHRLKPVALMELKRAVRAVGFSPRA